MGQTYNRFNPSSAGFVPNGGSKKNKTPKQAKNRRVHVPNHPGKHKELGCWPSPSKPSSTKDVFYVATTQGDEQSTQSPRRGAWGSWERAELQAVGMRGTTKYPYPCCTAWRRCASKYHMWSLIWRRSMGSLVPLPTPPGSALPSGSKHSSELHPGMLSPPYPGGKVGGWEAQRFKGSCANHSLRGKGVKKKKDNSAQSHTVFSFHNCLQPAPWQPGENPNAIIV